MDVKREARQLAGEFKHVVLGAVLVSGGHELEYRLTDK